jgi:hypothetical protein
VQSAHELHWIMFPGGHVVCGAHLLELQIHTSGVGIRSVGRIGQQLFPRLMHAGALLVPIQGPGQWGLCKLCDLGSVCHRV